MRRKKSTERKHGDRKTEFERSVCRDERGRSRESLFAPLWILLISLQFMRSRDTSFDASSRPTKRSLREFSLNKRLFLRDTKNERQ